MVSFVSMSAMTIPANDKDVGDKIEKVVDIGTPIQATFEVSADAFSTAISVDYAQNVKDSNVIMQSITAQNQTGIDLNLPNEVGWRNNIKSNKRNISEKIYRRTDHNFIRCSNYSNVKNKLKDTNRKTIRFPTIK